MISNPLTELTFGSALFSLSIVELSSNKIDASHPCKLIQYLPIILLVNLYLKLIVIYKLTKKKKMNEVITWTKQS
jgi:hypothetical protein